MLFFKKSLFLDKVFYVQFESYKYNSTASMVSQTKRAKTYMSLAKGLSSC